MSVSYIESIRESVEFDPRSVHYNKRKFDNQFEIVARAKVDGEWREVALDVQPSRVKALEAVRFLRGHNSNNEQSNKE